MIVLGVVAAIYSLLAAVVTAATRYDGASWRSAAGVGLAWPYWLWVVWNRPDPELEAWTEDDEDNFTA